MALEILKDSRETIILKEEIKSLLPKVADPSKKGESDDFEKTFLFQNLKRFQEELRRASQIQRNHHLFLQSQLEFLKSENLETVNKVLCKSRSHSAAKASGGAGGSSWPQEEADAQEERTALVDRQALTNADVRGHSLPKKLLI